MGYSNNICSTHNANTHPNTNTDPNTNPKTKHISGSVIDYIVYRTNSNSYTKTKPHTKKKTHTSTKQQTNTKQNNIYITP